MLASADVIAKGRARTIYQHPEKANVCIKIDHYEVRKDHTDTQREVAYYRRIMFFRRTKFFSSISSFYGLVHTNLGVGATFELIKDEATGAISRPLDSIAIDELGRRYDEISAALDRLIQSLFDEGIVLRDPHPGNIVVQELVDASPRLVFIDGIGHTNFLPIVDVFISLSRKKLARVLKRKRYSPTIKLMASAKHASDLAVVAQVRDGHHGASTHGNDS